MSGVTGTGVTVPTVPVPISMGGTGSTDGSIAAPVAITANSSTAALRVTQTGSGNALLVEDSANPDSTPFVVDTNGDVGIGTASPGQKLEVYDGDIKATSTSGSYVRINSGVSSGAYIQLNRAGSATQNAYIAQSNGNLYIKNLDSANTIFTNTTSDTERMRITNSGNVGIGATPSVRLHVNAGGTAEVARFESTNPYISLYDAGVRQAYFYSDSGAIRLYAEASKPLYLFTSGAQQIAIGTNNSERLRVDSSGNLLIGTTTAGASKLVVNDSSIQINTAKTPASATDTGTAGQVCWDASYIYVCTTSNTWKRAAIATW